MNERKESNEENNIKIMLGKNVRRLRTIANKSQLHLAAETELALSFINDIENGIKWVSAETIEKLVKALNVEPFQLFISETSYNNQDVGNLSYHLADFSDSIIKMITEYRDGYQPDNSKISGQDKITKE